MKLNQFQESLVDRVRRLNAELKPREDEVREKYRVALEAELGGIRETIHNAVRDAYAAGVPANRLKGAMQNSNHAVFRQIVSGVSRSAPKWDWEKDGSVIRVTQFHGMRGSLEVELEETELGPVLNFDPSEGEWLSVMQEYFEDWKALSAEVANG